jgi:hypothetical protein
LRLSGAVILIKMHNAPFYQTDCENFILEDFFSFRKSGQRKEAKERRNSDSFL